MLQLSSMRSIAPAIASPVCDPLNSFAWSMTLSGVNVSKFTQWAVKLSRESGETWLLQMSVEKLMVPASPSFPKTCSVTLCFSAGIVVPVMYLRLGTLYLGTAWAIKSRKPTLSTKERGRLQRTVISVIFSDICLAASLFSSHCSFARSDQGSLLRSIPLSLASCSCLSLELFVFVHMFRLQMFYQVRGIETAPFNSTSRNFQVANLAFSQCTRRRFYNEIIPHCRHFLLLVCFPAAWKWRLRAAIGPLSLVWSRPIAIVSVGREKAAFKWHTSIKMVSVHYLLVLADSDTTILVLDRISFRYWYRNRCNTNIYSRFSSSSLQLLFCCCLFSFCLSFSCLFKRMNRGK